MWLLPTRRSVIWACFWWPRRRCARRGSPARPSTCWLMPAPSRHLFLIVGILLDRHRTVDELELSGRGRGHWQLAGLYLLAALALAGLPRSAPRWESRCAREQSAVDGGSTGCRGAASRDGGAARSQPPTRHRPAKARRSRTRSCVGRRRVCTSRSPSCCWAAWDGRFPVRRTAGRRVG